ncbi:glycosyl hydrolase-related protein, partial [Nitrosomonas sp. Nm166]|uniref:glycosyl hydrolase-related protein n=1 Tax=Nitrosomonas sp. Nm166 TaxID=1881054 RepID=UPI0008F0C013
VLAQKRIYLAPDDHTDYMWTADEAEYEDAFLTMTDYYLDRMDATEASPAPYQARWNADGSFWMWVYQKNRSAMQFQRLIDRIKDGHFSMPLNALVLSNGGTPAEAVLRGMYYPGLIQRQYAVDFPIAIAMENQTLPYGLSSLWAGSGAKYSWKGVCGCSSHVPHLSNREREIYYVGGRDGSRVLMKWNSLMLNVTYDNTSIGGYAEGRDPFTTVNFVDKNASFTSRYPFPVIGIFGKGEDDFKTTDNEFITAAKQLTNANRQVIVSNQLDFFKDFETNHGADLETFAASYGNEWELYSASMSEVSARIKRAVEKLRSADALATLVSLKNPAFMDSRIAARDKAMLNFGLYFEHNWTADGPVSRAARADWQRKIAGEITSYVNSLYRDAKNQLGTLIARSGSNPRFYVFNSLSWTRTDYADFPVSHKKLVHVVDVSTGKQVPSQYVTVAGKTRLRILASDVPSVGYKVFEIRRGAGTVFSNAAAVIGNVIENDLYRVTVANTGAITSLIDKKRGNREFVRKINDRWVNDFGGIGGDLVVEDVGPVSVTLRATSWNPYSTISHITFIRDTNRIQIQNNIRQNFGEVLTWGYSFEIDSPNVWHEEVGAVIRAKLLADGGHYSPRNARYDWLTINHFADVSGGGVGVTLSNADAYYMKLGDSTHAVLDTHTPQLNILAGGQVDGPGLGIPDQGGDAWFLQRFALQTHDQFNQTSAMKFSLEHQNPLISGKVTGANPSYSENQYSFLTISDPDVLLWALKPAEDGIKQGVVARVWNQADATKHYTLSLGYDILSAKRTTHIETDIADASVVNGDLSASLAAHQIQTHRLLLD